MKEKIQNILTNKIVLSIISVIICAVFGVILTIYIKPMEDLSLDLSLMSNEDNAEPNFDEKGWTVFTREGDTVTLLEPDGFGGYTGIEPGQTLYFSRVLEEDLDSPTLQLDTANRRFSVFLDNDLIYTDCPELDNRIGYLTLPMNEWDRTEKITISLPLDYQGKTLTIAQSTPEHSEITAIRAYPCNVRLYCGYAYESGLIAESFQTAIVAAAAFIAGVFLLAAFVRNSDGGLLYAGLVVFLWMTNYLTNTSFFYTYFGTEWDTVLLTCRMLSNEILLYFLVSKAGKYKKYIWTAVAAYALSSIGYLITHNAARDFFISASEWTAFIGLIAVLVLGAVFWRKENGFYRLFAPLAPAVTAVYWVILLVSDAQKVGSQIVLSLGSGQISYIYNKLLLPVMICAVSTAVVETVRDELDRRTEKRLIEERRELTMASYENLRRQHEEVMMLRHDMNKHFQALRIMSGEKQITDYLDELIGQNEKIRPVIQSGNEMLDIILNGKLSAAEDAGVRVEIVKAEAPKNLPLSDADLCSLVMNIMDNAVKAAATSYAEKPYIKIDMHIKGNFFALVCENSANTSEIKKVSDEKTVPKHGYGLKIIRGIAERYDCLLDTEHGDDYYKIKTAIPLL